jgi:hypothetical protein
MQLWHIVEYFIGNIALAPTGPAVLTTVLKPVVRRLEDARNVPQND